jgi:plastocyanin
LEEIEMAKKRQPMYGTPGTIGIPSGNVPNPTIITVNAGDSVVFMNTDKQVAATKIVRYAADKQASKFHPFCLILPPGGQVEVLAEGSTDTATKDIVYYTVDTITDRGKIRKKRDRSPDDTYQVIVNS